MRIGSAALLRLSGLFALLMAGCGTSELSNNAEVNGRVAEALPVDTPAPVFVAQAIWFPHSQGFGSTDASPLGHASGVVALAGDKLWFMAWNNPEHHYDVLQSLGLPRAIAVRVDHFGPSAMLVVESWDRSFDAFELMRKGRFSSDPEATQALYAMIRALRAKNPSPDS
jgi:hypothetical protein